MDSMVFVWNDMIDRWRQSEVTSEKGLGKECKTKIDTQLVSLSLLSWHESRILLFASPFTSRAASVIRSHSWQLHFHWGDEPFLVFSLFSLSLTRAISHSSSFTFRHHLLLLPYIAPSLSSLSGNTRPLFSLFIMHCLHFTWRLHRLQLWLINSPPSHTLVTFLHLTLSINCLISNVYTFHTVYAILWFIHFIGTLIISLNHTRFVLLSPVKQGLSKVEFFERERERAKKMTLAQICSLSLSLSKRKSKRLTCSISDERWVSACNPLYFSWFIN